MLRRRLKGSGAVQQSWIKQVGESPTLVTASGLSSESRRVVVMRGAKRDKTGAKNLN